MKKLLLFGAGKIGRSFIGQLFRRSGYEVVFVDIDQKIVNQLNHHRQYRVIIKDGTEKELQINNVRGIHFSDTSQIIDEICKSSIMAISVGKNGIKAIMPIIAYGLLKRENQHKGAIDLIIAENMRNADEYIRSELKKVLPPGFPLKQRLGLIETSIGKMVPIMPSEVTKQNPLLVYAEAYNTLILDKMGFLNEIPDVQGLAPKENMKAWVDRKLFIHNFGHAVTAYLGYAYDPGLIYTWEPLQVNDILENVYQSMKQSASALLKLHPAEFTEEELEKHIEDLLRRFQNKNLGDTIFRVGSDLFRKLSPDDRIIIPLRTALQFKLPFNYISGALHAGIDFKATDEAGKKLPSDIKFQHERQKGKHHILKNVCKLTEKEIKQVKGAE